jgi:hypothetical protein
MLDLVLCPPQQIMIIFRAVPPHHPFCDTLTQKAVHRLAIGYGIPWKFIAKVAQLKLQARRKFDRVLNCTGNIVAECEVQASDPI